MHWCGAGRHGSRDIGRRVDIYWKENREFYRGTVVGFLKNTGCHQVLYDDGETLNENLSARKHSWLLPSARRIKRGFKHAAAKRMRPLPCPSRRRRLASALSWS